MTAETDLASRWLGGSVVAASDESFGEKENLLTPAPAAFEPGHYGHRGEIVDGWETRRRRSPGHDWVIVRLGAPGVITSVDVDTSFFTGNFPAAVAVEACGCEGYPSPDELTGWEQIVPRSAMTGDGHNVFRVTDGRRFTHVRLSAYPDGGIARLRVLGHVVPDPRGLEELTIDLAGQAYGGAVVASSDDFYTSAGHLVRPDRARTMGEGWETRRRRDGGHDHVVFRLAFPGVIRRIVVDTAHFKYNASAEVTLCATAAGSAPARWFARLAAAARPDPAAARYPARVRQPVRRVRRRGPARRLPGRRAVAGAADRQHRPGGAPRRRLPVVQRPARRSGRAVPDGRRDWNRTSPPAWPGGGRWPRAGPNDTPGPAATYQALITMLEGKPGRSSPAG